MYEIYFTWLLLPEWLSVLSFFAVAAFALVSQRILKDERHASLFVASMYFILASVATGFLAGRLMPEASTYLGPREEPGLLTKPLIWLKFGLYLVGLLLFIRDLQALRRGNPPPGADEALEQVLENRPEPDAEWRRLEGKAGESAVAPPNERSESEPKA